MTEHPLALAATILTIAGALWYLFRPSAGWHAAEDVEVEEAPKPTVVDRTPRNGDDAGRDVTK